MAVDTAVVARRLFTVEEFHRMGEAGVIAPEERVELIEGEIVAMSPIDDRHLNGTILANFALSHRLGTEVVISVQNPLLLGEGSEPYPDLVVLRRRPGGYSRDSIAADVLLVEISDTTLRYDLGSKAALYARHGIPEYWVEDIPGDPIVLHRDPTPEGYRTVTSLGRGERLSPLAFPAVDLRTDDLLG